MRRGTPRTGARGTAPEVTTTVLVLWVGHRAGPWTCRSLERDGYRVLRAHPIGAHGGRSPACMHPLRYPSATAEPDAFLDFVAHTCRTRGVSAVLPLDEDIVRLLAEREPDLGRRRRRGPQRAPVPGPVRQGRARRLRGARRGRPPAHGRGARPAAGRRLAGSALHRQAAHLGLERAVGEADPRHHRRRARRGGRRPDRGGGAGARAGARDRTAVGGPLRAVGSRIRLPRVPGRSRLSRAGPGRPR